MRKLAAYGLIFTLGFGACLLLLRVYGTLGTVSDAEAKRRAISLLDRVPAGTPVVLALGKPAGTRASGADLDGRGAADDRAGEGEAGGAALDGWAAPDPPVVACAAVVWPAGLAGDDMANQPMAVAAVTATTTAPITRNRVAGSRRVSIGRRIATRSGPRVPRSGGAGSAYRKAGSRIH